MVFCIVRVRRQQESQQQPQPLPPPQQRLGRLEQQQPLAPLQLGRPSQQQQSLGWPSQLPQQRFSLGQLEQQQQQPLAPLQLDRPSQQQQILGRPSQLPQQQPQQPQQQSEPAAWRVPFRKFVRKHPELKALVWGQHAVGEGAYSYVGRHFLFWTTKAAEEEELVKRVMTELKAKDQMFAKQVCKKFAMGRRENKINQ